MKRIYLRFYWLCSPLFAFADAVEINGIYYNLISKGENSRSNIKPVQV